MKMLRIGLLGAVAFLAVFTRSAPVSGKENVFNYQISVGKEASGSVFKQGFVIDTKVVVRKRTDNTYNLEITDVEVRSEKNQPIDKAKYSTLETKLKIPFDYNPSGGNKALTVYAPETKDCESANIKRGLINIMEFYDSGAKTIKKISDKKGSSGECPEVSNKESETATSVDLVRLTNLESNCTNQGWPHQKVRKCNVATMGTYCDVDPKINRNIVTKVSKSKDGSDSPQILIKATERLRLHSVFPSGLFDDITAKTVLELKEVRDATPETTPSGAPSQSCTEVKLDDGNHSHDAEQGDALKKASDGFKQLKHCLHKLDTESRLEDQEAAGVLLGLTIELKHLNKDSIKTLYKELDGEQKNAFFQVMGLTGSEDAIDAVKEIMTEETAANNPVIVDQVATFFENIDAKSPGISSKKGREIYDLYPKVAALPPSHSTDRLKHAVLMKAAAIHNEKCVRKGSLDKDCISNDKVWAKISANMPKDNHEKITFAKLIANLEIPQGVDYLKQTLGDKGNPINLRAEAAWACVRMVKRNGPALKDTLTKVFMDRTEDHEVRIAAYIALAKSATNSEVQNLVQYLIDNHENEDRQVVSFVVSSAVLKNMKKPDGSKCPDFASRAKLVHDTVRNVAKELGPRDMFDSQVHSLNSPTDKETAMAAVVASKTDILPRSIFFQLRDPLQNRAYIMQVVSDGVFYGNLANLKASYDKQKGPGAAPAGNADVKAALDNIFTKVKGAPANSNFSLILSERVDGLDVSMEHFDKPEAVVQKLMSATVGAEKFIRTFRKYNSFKVKSHTESGVHVKFSTFQGAITSLEVPQFAMGQGSPKTGVPISFKYSYKFTSKVAYAAVAQLPEHKYKYATGKIGTKAGHLPRNVTLSVLKKKVDQMTTLSVRGKSDPLWGSYDEGKDVFFRSLVPFSGNVENFSEYPNMVKKDTRPLDVVNHGQEYFGVGWTVYKSPDYIRPHCLETPLTRWSFKYQEVEDNPKPFYYRIALTKKAEDTNPTRNYELTVMTGFKNEQHIMLGGITFANPKDPSSKNIRLVVGAKVDITDPNKRAVLINYENVVNKIYIQGHTQLQMPDNNLKVPDVVKGTPEWAAAYGKEKIVFNGKSKFEPSGRKEVGDADVDALLNGLGDDFYAESKGELYRTDEQIALFGAGDNTVDGSDVSENPYARLIAKAHSNTKCSIKAWDKLLKFHGYRGEATFKKPIPEEIKHLHRRIKFLLAKKNYNFMTYDISLKTEDNKIKISSNSSVDNKRTDLMIQDRTGAVIFKGFESKIIPLLRPSSSPIKTFSHNTLNLPICSINAGDAKKEVESFDGRSIPVPGMTGDCEYLLSSNCRGVKNFALTYNKKDDSFTILYDNKHKIVVTKTGFTFDGTAQPDKNGLVHAVDDIALASYKGILAVKLPNKISFLRERDTSVGYIKASRLFRGRLCGLCGSMSGDTVSDDISALSDYAVSGGQCAA